MYESACRLGNSFMKIQIDFLTLVLRAPIIMSCSFESVGVVWWNKVVLVLVGDLIGSHRHTTNHQTSDCHHHDDDGGDVSDANSNLTVITVITMKLMQPKLLLIMTLIMLHEDGLSSSDGQRHVNLTGLHRKELYANSHGGYLSAQEMMYRP